MNKWLVGIPTYKRPEQLGATLRSLAEQAKAPEFDVCVVDNDESSSAAATVQQFQSLLNLIYLVEPRRGVVHVRNRILEAAKDYHILVFLDDDQVAEKDWLEELQRGTKTYPGSIIAGPRRFVLPEHLNGSHFAGLVFPTPSWPTGAVLAHTGTGNSLLPLNALTSEMRTLRFDPKFGLSGGEDTKYYSTLTRMGAKIQWWPTARISEPVPSERASAREMKKRLLRAGYVNAKLAIEDGRRTRTGLAYLSRLIVGSVFKVFGPTRRIRNRGMTLSLSGIGGLQSVRGKGLTYYGAGNDH